MTMTNSPEAQPQEAPDCPHLVVTMYPTKGRFASPQRYWSCQDCGADFAPSRADLPRTTLAELDVWDRLNERRHELIHLKRQQGFLEERDEMNFNALQWVAGLVRELVAGQPFQVNDNSTTTTPRATAFRPMCDDPECSVCKRMAELHAKNAPRVTGETTVEEWLPIETAPRDGTAILIAFPNGHVQQHVLKPAHIKAIWFPNGEAPTYWRPMPKAPCMAQVRAASRTEGEGKSND